MANTTQPVADKINPADIVMSAAVSPKGSHDLGGMEGKGAMPDDTPTTKPSIAQKKTQTDTASKKRKVNDDSPTPSKSRKGSLATKRSCELESYRIFERDSDKMEFISLGPQKEGRNAWRRMNQQFIEKSVTELQMKSCVKFLAGLLKFSHLSAVRRRLLQLLPDGQSGGQAGPHETELIYTKADTHFTNSLHKYIAYQWIDRKIHSFNLAGMVASVDMVESHLELVDFYEANPAAYNDFLDEQNALGALTKTRPGKRAQGIVSNLYDAYIFAKLDGAVASDATRAEHRDSMTRTMLIGRRMLEAVASLSPGVLLLFLESDWKSDMDRTGPAALAALMADVKLSNYRLERTLEHAWVSFAIPALQGHSTGKSLRLMTLSEDQIRGEVCLNDLFQLVDPENNV